LTRCACALVIPNTQTSPTRNRLRISFIMVKINHKWEFCKGANMTKICQNQ
jgi:hypothetical protein